MKSLEITRKLTPVEEAIKEHIARGVPFSECMFRPGSEAFTEFYTRVREMRESLDLDWQDQELLDTDIGECIMIEGERVPLDVPIAEEVELDEAETKFVIKHKKTKRVLSTHNNYNDAKDELNGISDKNNYMLVKQTKKDAALANRNTMREEVEIDEAEYQGKQVKLNSPKRGGPKKFYVYVKNPKTGRVKKISWGDTTGLSVKSGNRDRVRSFVARHKCKQKNDKMKAGYWACRTPRYKALGVKGGAWW